MVSRTFSAIPLLLAGMILGFALTGGLRAEDDETPTHIEIDSIPLDIGSAGKLVTMAMDSRGNLLCGVSWLPKGVAAEERPSADRRPPSRRPGQRVRGQRPGGGKGKGGRKDDPRRLYALKVISPAGRVIDTWPMKEVHPKMLNGAADGSIYVFGPQGVLRLDDNGKVTARVKMTEILDGRFKGAHASGITANQDYVFIAIGNGGGLRSTEDVVRLGRDLQSPELIVEGQFGCCSHIDLDTRDGVLIIAENSRHRVNRFSFDGEKLGTWGSRDRDSIEGFAACCNPVNFDFGPGDVLYTAESGIGRVKKYTADGEFLGLVGYVDTTKFDRASGVAAQSCYIPVEVSKDGDSIYVMDVRKHSIRVLKRQDRTVSQLD